jgi:alkanesulfonate monooxygenase SsuD/methylene tetrahydromethanopterin reductase-like flavin-dependent oxidoreductase (luciferase family)
MTSRSPEEPDLQFGIFDHLDRNELPLREFYADRIRLTELYDRLGFFCYHIAEHHVTPLGLASSPSVFLSGVAQRTGNLNFGPLVYTLPMHHPIGLIEEICMLDQMSGGRLQVGVGKGISPIETAYFGVDPEVRQAMYLEALEIIRRGLTSKTLSYSGKYYTFKNVPMELEPLQKPHPPLWMGVASPQAAETAARTGCSFVCLSTAAQMRDMTDRYRAVAGDEVRGRKMGLGRFVIVAETDDEALRIARRTYPKWHAHFHHLYRQHGKSAVHGDRPADFDQIKDGGRGIAGSPATVVRMLREQLAEAGANYFVGQFAFGDLSFGEAAASIELFAREVMPPLREFFPS